jgi:hypothetical protein
MGDKLYTRRSIEVAGSVCERLGKEALVSKHYKTKAVITKLSI